MHIYRSKINYLYDKEFHTHRISLNHQDFHHTSVSWNTKTAVKHTIKRIRVLTRPRSVLESLLSSQSRKSGWNSSWTRRGSWEGKRREKVTISRFFPPVKTLDARSRTLFTLPSLIFNGPLKERLKTRVTDASQLSKWTHNFWLGKWNQLLR